VIRENGWDKRKAVCLIKKDARRLYTLGCPALQWIGDLAQASSGILLNLGLVSDFAAAQIVSTARLMVSQIQENHKHEDVGRFGINELAVFSNPRDSVQLSTIHSAKGLEWDAVAIVDLHEGKIPHSNAADMEEAKRLFYVGCTRAKKLLMLFTHGNREPSRFLEIVDH
jgi:DNA helicase-2/ATP-dependent DNA helicase PcrA